MNLLTRTSRIAAFGRLLFLSLFGCSQLHLRVIRRSIILLLAMPVMASAAPLNLSSDTSVATAGYYQLHWRSDETIRNFALQESRDRNFANATTIYRGKDLARVISGKPDNDYYYRISNQDNPEQYSNIVKVTVAHHPLSTAFTFFGIGAFVFLAILIVVFRGEQQG